MTKEERIRYLKGLLKCELCEEESTKICKSCDNRRIGSSAKCYDALKEVIKALEQEQKAINEWCTDCKEYDHEKHCCPRFSQVIKNTVQEMHDNQWVLCSERLPKRAEGGTSDWHTDSVMVSAYGNLAYNGWEHYKHEILIGEFSRYAESNRLVFEPNTITLFVPDDMDVIPLDEEYTYHADKDECTFYSDEGLSETEYHDKFIQIQAWRPLPEPYQPKDGEK